MASIEELTVLTEEHPIPYTSKLIVYFIFENMNNPIILTTRYVSEKNILIEWFKKAQKDTNIKIVAVWPGNYRSEAFLCNPIIALKAFNE